MPFSLCLLKGETTAEYTTEAVNKTYVDITCIHSNNRLLSVNMIGF